MAAKTENDVITRALRILRVTPIGETSDASLYAVARDIYQAYHNELLAELRDAYKLNRRTWGYNAVPDSIWINVAWLLANELIGEVPASQEAEARAERRAPKAMGGIVKVLSRQKSRHTRYPDFPINREGDYRFSG